MTHSRIIRLIAGLGLAGLLACAVFLPLMEVRTLWVFKDEVTLIMVAWTLMTENDFVLGLLILLLGIMAPFGKCALLAFHELAPGTRMRRVFEALNIFSSLDAFLIALAIFLMKMAEVSKPEIMEGMGFLVAFIVGSKLAEFALLADTKKGA